MLANETGTESQEVQLGVLSENDALTSSLTDEEVGRIIGKRIENGKTFWNKHLNLDDVREQVEKYYLNTALDEASLYDFQVPYKDNRILISIETGIAMINSKPPEPVVTQAFDTEASYELASNLGKVLLTHYRDLFLKQKTAMVLRHLLIGYRLGVMKYSWNSSLGPKDPKTGERMGAIDVSVIRPHKIILDEDASDIEDIPLIAEVVSNTAEELLIKFPNKQEQIYRELGFTRGTRSQLGKRVGYYESWFSHYGEKGEKEESVSWELGQTVLGSMKNPHYNYDEYEKNKDNSYSRLNFFDRPKKPYVFFNFLNLGKWVIDDTSLTDQAIPLQDVLNKRGRQMVENADSANTGLAFSEDYIGQEDVAKLTGDPGEKIVGKGDVTKGVMRLPVNQLQPLVLQDKNDARSEIDNIYGTHAPVRGEKSQAPTLGQEVLSQRSDMGRTLTLSDCIEMGFTRLYQGLAQMMKVFWDENTMVGYTGDDGTTTFLDFNREKIEDGVKIYVKAGSALPDDRFSKREETLKALAILDPLSIAEGLSKPNPKEFAKRMVYYKFAMDRYLAEILQVEQNGAANDDLAKAHIQRLNLGEVVPPMENPTKEHLATHDVDLKMPYNQELDPEIKQLKITHIRGELELAKEALGITEQGTPAPEPTPEAGGQPLGGEQPGEVVPGAEPGVTSGAGQQQQGFMSKLFSVFNAGQK